MAYEEPGVKVIQELQVAAANIAAAEQAPTIVGELYEVFDDEVTVEGYDAIAAAQTVAWPSKKTSSVVDLAGVRKSIAEVDSQLNEFAPYPLAWKLRDPSTSATFDIDVLTDIYAINQTGFSVIASSSAATARSSGVAAADLDRQFHFNAGGFITAGLVVGDRVKVDGVLGTVSKVYDDTVFFDPDGYDLVMSAAAVATDTSVVAAEVVSENVLPSSGLILIGDTEMVAYSAVATVAGVTTFTVDALTLAHASGSSVKIQVLDTPTTVTDGDLTTTPGYFTSVTGGLTGEEGSRVAMWVEQAEVDDGVTAVSTVIDATSLALTKADIGKKISVHKAAGSDTQADGDANAVAGQLASALATFAAGDVGRVIKITAEFRRITSVIDANTITYSGAAITGVTLTYIVFVQDVRSILAVDGTDITVDGADLAVETAVPLVLHRSVYRDLVADDSNSDSSMRYSGAAVSGDTGFELQLPVDRFNDDIAFSVFPDYELLCTFRALDLSSVNKELVVYQSSDLTGLGGVVKDNTLVWAANTTLTAMGTNDRPLILLPVDLYPNDDAGDKSGYPEDQDESLGYSNALDILALNDSVYFQVYLTRNTTVGGAFHAASLAESAPETKHERVSYHNYALPLGATESTTGVIVPGLDGGNKVLNDVGQNFLSDHGIIPGNVVVISTPAAFAGEYVVAAGSTEDDLLLEGDNWQQDDLGAYLDTAKEMQATDGNFGGHSGNNTTFTLAGSTITLVVDFAVDASDVGRTIVVDSATTGGNDGSFTILTVPTTGSVTFLNAGGASEAGVGTAAITADNDVGVLLTDFKDAEVGDYLLVGSVSRRISAVSANGSILYARVTYEGTALALGVAQSVSVLRSAAAVNFHVNPLNKAGQASALAAISSTRGSRRAVHMWPDNVEMITGTDSQGNDVKEMLPSYFAAAAEAGRDSVIPAARSSTGAALAGFTGLEHSNRYFNKTQLNTIAGGGWAILEQQTEGADVVMRHLLTTDMSAVKNQELAFTKNVDNMAKVKRASVEPLLNDDNGRVNITADFLTALAFPFQGIYENFVKEGQLVRTADAAPYKILSIRQDPTQEDTILEDTELNVPLPANKVVVTFIL